MKYAGVPTDRLHVVEGLADGLDHALARRQRPALRPADLHRAARAARPARRARRRQGVLAMSDDRLARRRVRRLHRRPAAVARAGRGRGRPGARRRRGRRAAWRSTSPRRGHDVTALDLDAALLAELAARAARERPRGPHRAGRRRRLRARRPAVRAHPGPDADHPAAPGPRRARRLPGLARATTSRPAGWSRSRVAEELEPFEADLSRSAAARHRRARRLALPLVPGRHPRPRRPSSCSSACARLIAPDGTRVERGRRGRAGHAQRPRPRGRGPRRRACAPEPPRGSRRPTSTSARRW